MMMMFRRGRGLLPVAVACAAAWAMPAMAQQSSPPPAEEPPAEKPAEKPAAEPKPPAADPLPGLDDLLGIDRNRTGDLQDPVQKELERRLAGQQISGAFREAVALMGQASERLGQASAQDRTGIGTQRIQQDAAKKLEELISQMEQNSRRQRSQSSASSSQQQNSQPSPAQQRAEATEPNQGENQGETEPPGRQDGPLRPELDSARASWGALPPRVRDMLLQGSNDRFSSMYEKMTEAYYRRLAEERRGN